MATNDKPAPQDPSDRSGPPPELVLRDEQVQAINRFPDQNPNPVMRMSMDGHLLYANISSAPIRRALDVEVGDPLPADFADRLRSAASSGDTVELEHEHRTFAVLPVHVADLGFINVYGTDITAQKAIDKFPGQNPNPVLRMTPGGTLIYANAASAPLVGALGLEVGGPLPIELRDDILRHLAGDHPQPLEIPTAGWIYEILPVSVEEFGFINLYGTDVTAARAIEEANRENERLLLNILPPPIAQRLRAGERVIADRFEDVTLLIADIVGFTELSSGLRAEEVVDLLNRTFSAVDALVDRHGLEKIKTIGDAYMIVGGLPIVTDDHAQRVAALAIELVGEVDKVQGGQAHPIQVRVGISCGPVVAGVIGVKKFIYDVWGDTVNTASRMESLSLPGRIHVSHAVYARLRDQFVFEPRGMIEVKGKGHMPTYFLVGRG